MGVSSGGGGGGVFGLRVYGCIVVNARLAMVGLLLLVCFY